MEAATRGVCSGEKDDARENERVCNYANYISVVAILQLKARVGKSKTVLDFRGGRERDE